MKNFLLALLLVSAAAHAGTAFYSHESSNGGMHKICYYDYLGDEVAITIGAVELCPLTIEV